LAAITLCERALWASDGPLLAADAPETDVDGYVVWPSWAAFLAFYAAVREELYATRPHLAEKSTAEACFRASLAGDDPESTREALRAEREANDPRWLLQTT
jgi:hypothetical protein